MFETFYIIETRPGCYQLRMRDTHFVLVGVPQVEKCLQKVTEYTAKYKSGDRMRSVVANLEMCGVDSEETLLTKDTEYSLHGHEYDDQVREAVEAGLVIARQNSPFNQIRSRIKPPTPKEVEVQEEVVRPKIIKKPFKIIRTRLIP